MSVATLEVQDGCLTELGSKISQMAATGFLDNSLETDAHPVHKIWYAEVLDKPLPSDLVIATGDYGVDHRLRRLHRSLTLEQLLRKLSPTWSAEVADSIRGKLHNLPDFESTLYELQVALNFREAGHHVSIGAPGASRSTDIEGTILGVPTNVDSLVTRPV